MTRRHVRRVDSITTEPRGHGELVQLETTLIIGGVPTPAWPVLEFRQARIERADPEEDHRTRERVGGQSEGPVGVGIEGAR